MIFHPIVQRQADNRRRNASEHDLAPKLPRVAAPLLALAGRKRIELMKKQHADSKDCTQLNNHQKHVEKCLAHVELDKLIDQDHMTGRRDGQPFRDALDQTQEGRFKQFDDIQKKPFA